MRHNKIYRRIIATEKAWPIRRVAEAFGKINDCGKMDCPQCGGKQSIEIDENTNLFRCHQCDGQKVEFGTPNQFALAMWLTGFTFMKVLDILSECSKQSSIVSPCYQSDDTLNLPQF